MKTFSKTVTSELSACKKTALIWQELARTGANDKMDAIEKVFSPASYFSNDCLCCEFVDDIEIDAGIELDGPFKNCPACPMKDFWPSTMPFYTCCDKESEDDCSGIFMLWVDAEELEDHRKYATTIYHLALEASEYWQGMKDMNS